MSTQDNPFIGWAFSEDEAVMRQWPIGTLTKKAGGYDWPGRVCGYNVPSTGRITIGVENRLCPGTVHVFPPHQLEKEDRSEKKILAQVAARML